MNLLKSLFLKFCLVDLHRGLKIWIYSHWNVFDLKFRMLLAYLIYLFLVFKLYNLIYFLTFLYLAHNLSTLVITKKVIRLYSWLICLCIYKCSRSKQLLTSWFKNIFYIYHMQHIFVTWFKSDYYYSQMKIIITSLIILEFV